MRSYKQSIVVVEELDVLTANQMFDSANVYLGAKLTSSLRGLKVHKLEKEQRLALIIDRNQELVDKFEGVNFKWVLVSARRTTMVMRMSGQMSSDSENQTKSADDEKYGLLNFIDGLWSSCGDERIVVSTMNHLDRLDPALLRREHMDLHLHMSYCNFSGFRY
ncbi:AAA-ATPase, partial [Cucurbita argyrosperma subsp. sororia]